MKFSTEDLTYIKRCFELADEGKGFVSPNPFVGTVIVKDGSIIGEGWHENFGGAHAEVNAVETSNEEKKERDVNTIIPMAEYFLLVIQQSQFQSSRGESNRSIRNVLFQ